MIILLFCYYICLINDMCFTYVYYILNIDQDQIKLVYYPAGKQSVHNLFHFTLDLNYAQSYRKCQLDDSLRLYHSYTSSNIHVYILCPFKHCFIESSNNSGSENNMS